LKIYPNGNGGIAKGNYLSIFLEMVKVNINCYLGFNYAFQGHGKSTKYEYKIEMIN